MLRYSRAERRVGHGRRAPEKPELVERRAGLEPDGKGLWSDLQVERPAVAGPDFVEPLAAIRDEPGEDVEPPGRALGVASSPDRAWKGQRFEQRHEVDRARLQGGPWLERDRVDDELSDQVVGLVQSRLHRLAARQEARAQLVGRRSQAQIEAGRLNLGVRRSVGLARDPPRAAWRVSARRSDRTPGRGGHSGAPAASSRPHDAAGSRARSRPPHRRRAPAAAAVNPASARAVSMARATALGAPVHHGQQRGAGAAQHAARGRPPARAAAITAGASTGRGPPDTADGAGRPGPRSERPVRPACSAARSRATRWTLNTASARGTDERQDRPGLRRGEGDVRYQGYPLEGRGHGSAHGQSAVVGLA